MYSNYVQKIFSKLSFKFIFVFNNSTTATIFTISCTMIHAQIIFFSVYRCIIDGSAMMHYIMSGLELTFFLGFFLRKKIKISYIENCTSNILEHTERIKQVKIFWPWFMLWKLRLLVHVTSILILRI